MIFLYKFPSPYGDFVFQLYNEVLPIHSVF